MLTTVKTLANPVPLLADQFPGRLLSHNGGYASERDLRAVRVAFDP